MAVVTSVTVKFLMYSLVVVTIVVGASVVSVGTIIVDVGTTVVDVTLGT